MTEPIVTRERIATEAEAAAKLLNAGEVVTNPYPLGSDAAAAWDASVVRYLSAMRDEEMSA